MVLQHTDADHGCVGIQRVPHKFLHSHNRLAAFGQGLNVVWSNLDPYMVHSFTTSRDKWSHALETVTAHVAADFDGDCDVDHDDYLAFEACGSGPAIPLTGGCEPKDLDHDNDVDASDFGLFQRCYSGANNPAAPNCS